jgi:hypothetical protein
MERTFVLITTYYGSNDSVGVEHLKDGRVAEVYGIMALMI